MRKLIAAVTIAASFAIVPAANAAEEAFLRVDGLTGDAQVQNQTGYIGIGSFSWGTENKATIGATSGAAAGKATFKELTIEKNVDATSPQFFQRMASGQHFKSMELVIRKSGTSAGTAPYLRYHFQTAFVVGTDTAGGTGEESTRETIKFAFGAASQDFRGQSPTGTQLPPVFSGWNIVKNLAVTSYPALGTPAF